MEEPPCPKGSVVCKHLSILLLWFRVLAPGLTPRSLVFSVSKYFIQTVHFHRDMRGFGKGSATKGRSELGVLPVGIVNVNPT